MNLADSSEFRACAIMWYAMYGDWWYVGDCSIARLKMSGQSATSSIKAYEA